MSARSTSQATKVQWRAIDPDHPHESDDVWHDDRQDAERLALSLRFKRVDAGHFILPETPYEIVEDYTAAPGWTVLQDDRPIATRETYNAARTCVIDLLTEGHNDEEAHGA